MTTPTTTRNATLDDLATMLKGQEVRKLDVVASSTAITSHNGVLTITGTEPVLTPDGVSTGDGHFRPTQVCDEGMASKLGIPGGYLRRLRAERTDLYDANINGWLHGSREVDGDTHPADPRSFLVRTFRGEEGGEGIARAVLSNSYSVIDHLDALVATLAGVRDAGVGVDIDSCDLTDRRMYVRVKCQEVSMLAPALLKGYRSPYSGLSGSDNPTVFAGFVISNSETGSGAFTITPRLIVEVCSNGMTVTKDALRAVHLGSRMDDGVIRWSEDTQARTLDLITAKTRDAVRTFLDVDYMGKVIAGLEEAAGVELPAGESVEIVKMVSKKLLFNEATSNGVLDHFIRGGQVTAGGVMQAVTSFAQTIEDADLAAEVEGTGVRALELAAAGR